MSRLSRAGIRRIDPAIAALTAIAFAAGFYRLGTKGLWLDEAFSANYARLGFGGLLRVLTKQDPNMGGYYLLLHLWVSVFGSGATAVRSMSALVGALAVPFAVLLGTRMFGRTAGLVAGLLLALNPFFVHYEQTARAYALVVLLVMVSCYAFMSALENPTRLRLLGYVIASALSVYAHYFAALVLLVQFAALIALAPGRTDRRRWAIAAAAIVLLCLPEAAFAASEGGNGLEWIGAPTLRDLIGLPSGLAGGLVLAILLSVLACYGFARAFTGGRRRQAVFAAAWLLVPVALDFAASRLGHPMFLDRYLIVVLPALLLLAAAGVAALPRRGAVAASAALAVAMLAYAGSWYEQPSVEGFRGATAYVLSAARPGDAIAYDPELKLGGPAQGVAYYESLAAAAEHRPERTRLAALTSDPSRRLWLVVRDTDVPTASRERLEAEIARRYVSLARETRFRNLTVILYAPKVAAGRPMLASSQDQSARARRASPATAKRARAA